MSTIPPQQRRWSAELPDSYSRIHHATLSQPTLLLFGFGSEERAFVDQHLRKSWTDSQGQWEPHLPHDLQGTSAEE